MCRLSNRGNRISSRRLALLGAFVLYISAPATAQILVVQNDSIVDFGQAAIQSGFVAEERGAAWLTPACDGEIVTVRILWLDLINSGTQTLGEAITVSDAGAFPVPGSQLAQLVGPILTEGVFNDFLLAPTVPVTSGETFVVDFKFLTSPPAIGPSLVTDTDGCQAMKNGVFAIPPSSWLDLCPFGVSGDLSIRALVSCSGAIFGDGFESGDTSAWSVTEPPGSAPPSRPVGREIPVLEIDPSSRNYGIRVDAEDQHGGS